MPKVEMSLQEFMLRLGEHLSGYNSNFLEHKENLDRIVKDYMKLKSINGPAAETALTIARRVHIKAQRVSDFF